MRGVTKQQIEQTKQMDLLTYMMTYEPQELVRVGAHDYKTRTHDSLCISDNGLWHWCSRNIGGKTALNYLIRVKGMDFVSAVRCLCETEPDPALFQQVKPSISAKSEENKPFALPALDAGNEAPWHTCGGAVSTKKCCKPALRQALSRRPRAAVTKIVCLLGVVRTALRTRQVCAGATASFAAT